MGLTKTSPDAYRSLFGTALALAVSEGGSLALARSRAAVTTWRSAAGLSFAEAERVRVEAFAAFLEERGEQHPTRAGAEPEEPVEGVGVLPDVEDDRAPVQVPRGTALPGDKVRRGGKP